MIELTNRPLTEEEQKESFNGNKVNTDLLLPLLAAVFSPSQYTIDLEKEVANLKGRVDTLEKVILH